MILKKFYFSRKLIDFSRSISASHCKFHIWLFICKVNQLKILFALSGQINTALPWWELYANTFEIGQVPLYKLASYSSFLILFNQMYVEKCIYVNKFQFNLIHFA